jgi:hypothetical protein
MRHLQYWRRMLSVAAICFISQIKTTIFFPPKREKEKRAKEEKKDMQV